MSRKKPHLSMAEVDALTFEDGQLFHDARGRAFSAPSPLAPLADTHGHLGSLEEHDPGMALARAALAGVRLLVCPIDPAFAHEFPDTWNDPVALEAWFEKSIDAARRHLARFAELGLEPPTYTGAFEDVPELLENVHLIAGAHPYSAGEFDDVARNRLEQLLASKRAVGVGEIGLDFGPYCEVPEDVQVHAFREQLRIAHTHGLPVELHLRDGEGNTHAHDVALAVLTQEGVPEAGCDLHCFTDDFTVMEPFVSLGCYVAFGGAATFKRSEAIRAAALACPGSRILSETDAPYMAPEPLRGGECEPAMVAFSAELLATIRAEVGMASKQETYEAFWVNAVRLCGLDQ